MFFYQENVGYADKQVMRWFNLLIFIAVMLTAPAIAGEHSSAGTPATKDAVIERLIKIENENKALFSGARDLIKFSNAIDGPDSFDCFEKRCINAGQLQLKFAGVTKEASILVDLGGSKETITVIPEGNPLDFHGTLGEQFVGQIWANSCWNQRLTKIELTNVGGSNERVDMIELKLAYGNGIVKTIFKIEQPFVLARNHPQRYSLAEIKGNSAYQSAKVASCQD